MRKLLSIVIAGSLFTLAQPAFANHGDTSRADDSIWIGSYGSISSWRPVSNNELIVWASPSRAYLVEIWRPTRGLRFANRLGISRTVGRITRFDSVYVDGQRLPITAIRRIDAKVAKGMKYSNAAR